MQRYIIARLIGATAFIVAAIFVGSAMRLCTNLGTMVRPAPKNWV